MAPFILKFKGNKSFVAFHNMNDGDSLTKTWKVCTKVAAHLEQGQRLENLSWRLWHLHNIMVESDNAKSKREFKKLSRNMGDKLDREKGKNIEELRAPGYKRTQNSDKFRRRAEELERHREDAQSGGGMRRMQFTFSLDTPSPSLATTTTKPRLSLTAVPVKKSGAFKEQSGVFKEPAPKVDSSKKPATSQKDPQGKRSSAQSPWNEEPAIQPSQPTQDHTMTDAQPSMIDANSPPTTESSISPQLLQSSVHFPGIFSNNFGPSALLYPSPSFTPSNTYGEDVTMSYAGTDSSPNGGMGVSRPTIELPLDELLDVDDTPNGWGEILASIDASQSNEDQSGDTNMQHNSSDDYNDDSNNNNGNSNTSNNDEKKPYEVNMELLRMLEADRLLAVNKAIISQQSEASQSATYAAALPFYPRRSGKQRQTSERQTSVPSQAPATLNPMALLNNPAVANGTAISTSTRASNAPGATVVPISTPAGTKTECSNCGATHTPLWRRGLNDELNCNACGLYCKLHKRPRPKTMRASTGESSRSHHNHARAVDTEVVGAKCFNCNTTATPLWRKDDEGKTVCNACGLYYKLHGSNRPMSMKSDVVRKRSRHDLKRFALGGTSSESSSTSPGTSRRASPARATSPQPSVAEDDRQEEQRTPQFSFDYTTPSPRSVYGTKETSSSNDMLSSVSTQEQNDEPGDTTLSAYAGFFPGPYHPDFLYESSDLLPIQTSVNGESSAYSVEDRGNKRRRLSSASYESSTTPTEPPPSATSMNSNHRSPTASPTFTPYGLPYQSIYSSYQSFDETTAPWMKGDSDVHPRKVAGDDAPMAYLHPPMVLPSESSSSSHSTYTRPPMLPVEETAMSYLHPPMLPQANSPIVGYSHPPMLPSYWSHQGHNDYDTSNNANDTCNAMEMFESIVQPMD